MTHYICMNQNCPRRNPVTAAEPPTCYTCGGKMVEASTYRADTARISFNGIRSNGVLDGPFIEIPEPTQPAAANLDLAAPVEHSSADALDLGRRFAATAETWSQPTPGIWLNIPEPTPEQHTTRALPPITIEVAPFQIADLEAFGRDLQAEILRALTTIDRVPYDEPVTFRNKEHVSDDNQEPTP